MGSEPHDICPHLSCTGCGACRVICPVNAISFANDQEGFWYPSIDVNRCVGCNACRRVCPSNKVMAKNAADIKMAWSTNEDLVAHSSSGGIFGALASHVVSCGGLVVGVRREPDGLLHHVAVDSESDLQPMRKSKYYQSDTEDTFRAVANGLRRGRRVLFSGTACQVAALLSYLEAVHVSRAELLAVDVLCHGVVSRKLVDSFLASKEEVYGCPIVDLSFRTKDNVRGWQDGSSTATTATLQDGTRLIDPDQTFFKGFNENIFLRESCYVCRYCGLDRVSDITIADYWGVTDEEVPEERLRKGVSLVLLNTRKGRDEITKLTASGALVVSNVDAERAVAHNAALDHPNSRPTLRNRSYQLVEDMGYDRAVHRMFRRDYTSRAIKDRIKAIVGARAYQKLKKTIKGSQ